MPQFEAGHVTLEFGDTQRVLERGEYHRAGGTGPGPCLAICREIVEAREGRIWAENRDGVEYRDLGPDRFDRRDRSRVIHRLVRRLRDLGCAVAITPEAAA